MTPALIADFDRFSQRALLIGVAALALCGVGWFLNPDQFFRAYLWGRDRGFAVASAWMRDYRAAETSQPMANGEIIELKSATR